MFDEIYPKFDNKPVIPTKRASQELVKTGLDLDDVVFILQNGFDCSTGKHSEEVIEKEIKKSNKLIKAVVIEYQKWFKLIHVGSITFPKGLEVKK